MFGTGWELERASLGRLEGFGDIKFDGVSIDSRTIKNGQVFVAIKGERFDGHNFINDAIKKGAKGVIVRNGFNIKPGKGFFVIFVGDTKDTLGKISNYWRKKVSPKVIAITGSCGKTSTKEIIHSILSRKYKTLKNFANLNNYFGVSLTLLNLRNEDFAVIEAGINQKNEMEDIAKIIEPDCSLITNIAPVHLEGLKSLDEIFNEKRILLDYAKEAVFINMDDKRLRNYKRKGIKIKTFGKSGDISYKKVDILNENTMAIKLQERGDNRVFKILFPYAGIALASNISASVAVGRYFQIRWDDIIDGIKNVSLPKMRMEIKEINNVKVILDAYNANPYSMKNAIETFNKLDFKRKSLILGDMKELGKWSAFYHSLFGKYLAKFDFQEIFFVGDEIEKTYLVLKRVRKTGVSYFKTLEDCKNRVKRLFRDSDAVLIKGSRAVALEKILEEA